MSVDKTKTPPRDPGGSGHDDAGHDAVSAAYRRAADEEPPAHLDAAVLSMAHREVNGIHVATPRPRWFVPVAVAATVVIAVSLGLQVSRTPYESVAVISGDDPDSPAADEATVAAQDEAASDAGRGYRKQAAPLPRAAAPSQVAPPSTPETAAMLPPKPDELNASVMESTRRRAPDKLQAMQNIRRDADALAQVDASWAPDGAVRDAMARARDEGRGPAAWLASIKSLVEAGEEGKARVEWLAFRAVYPDEPLPPDFPEFE